MEASKADLTNFLKSLSGTIFDMSAWWLMLIMLLGALGFFAWTMMGRLALLKAAMPANRLDNMGKRFADMLLFALGQKRMPKEPLGGLAHILIFGGFMILTIRVLTMIIHGFGGPMLGGTIGTIYEWVKDIFMLGVLIGLSMAAYRRLVLKPDQMTQGFGAYKVLVWIFFIIFTDIIYDAALYGATDHGALWGKLVGSMFVGASPTTVLWIGRLGFWLHLALVFGFLNYLPYGKHFHVLTSFPNVFLKKTDPTGQLSMMDLEDETAETFGVGKIDEFTWKQYLDMFTCTECGRCSRQCPAHNSDKPLSPKKLMYNLRNHLYANQKRLIAAAKGKGSGEESAEAAEVQMLSPEVIEDDVIWSCTTCRACEEACPVFIEYVDKIVDMRRYLVLMESRFPKELTRTFKGMENNSNPWGLGYDKRAAWMEGLEVPIYAGGAKSETLYFVGCAGAFDDRYQKVARSMVKILQTAGVDFAVLGEEEGCTGDSARRAGNEMVFQMLAATNIETFKGYGVKKIITTCPHCYNSLKNEYPQLGGDFEVIYHTDLIKELLQSGKLKLKGGEIKNVVYHDPCYLGRYNEIYDSPREVLGQAGITVSEASKNRHQGLCCGAGGARMWMEEEGTRMNHNRFDNLKETGCKDVAVGCPFCLTMLEDATKDKGVEEDYKVKDIAELVARAIDE